MDKKSSLSKILLPAAAASAFCGVLLYATGEVLNYLFRDVDKKGSEQSDAEPAEDARPESQTI